MAFPSKYHVVSVFQLLSHVWLFATPWTAADQVSLAFSISQSLFKLMFTESVMPSSHLILSRSPPAFDLSQHKDGQKMKEYSSEFGLM